MKPLDMQAEKFVATGNIASEGMRNQLGRPRLDRLCLLVREAAQNSWDAKAPDAAVVTFGLAGWTLSAEQFEFLDRVVFAKRPPPHATDSSEAASLGQTIRDTSALIRRRGDDPSHRLMLLAVYDRGTTGLGGPTRADQLGSSDEPRDFVDFFRNVGTPPDKAQGGGTFGYGKAALYLSSAAHTILVHTRIRHRGELESRFMGSALTNHYSAKSELFTGRHWWGRLDERDGIVDPACGAEADEIAAALGFPAFVRTSRGTTVGIVAPQLGAWTNDPRRAFEYMAWQLVVNFWPKMIPWPDEPRPRMKFEVSWEGKSVPVPDPAKSPPFDGFVEALQNVRKAEQAEEKSAELWCLRPKKLLGRLALTKCFTTKSPLSEFAEDGTVPDIHTRSHHVALLRRPELVVEYRSFGALPSDAVGYAGVFLADRSTDRAFAGAEPPTHDTWSPEILNDKRYRTYVRTAFKRIDEAVRAFTGPESVAPPAGEGGPLASFADHLGSVLIGIEGPGASIQAVRPPGPKKKRGSRAPARPRVDVRDTGRILATDDGRVRLFEVDVRHAKDSRATQLAVKLGTALLGGGTENEPPMGSLSPRIAFWRSPQGKTIRNGDDSMEASEGVWELAIAVPTDAVVTVDVTGSAIETGQR